MKKLIVFVTLAIVATSCINKNDYTPTGELSNRDLMKQLKIEDPAIWNTLATQVLSADTFELQKSSEVKSAKKIREYPKNGKYYYALFEDLFPSEGDYDFNDVMIRSKLGWNKSKSTNEGYISSELINHGGVLPVKLGVMFYKVSGKTYIRIPYENITVNGEQLSDKPWTKPLAELGDSWTINYVFENTSSNIWINYFIEVNDRKILTSGFAPVDVETFTVPRGEYLNQQYLPWGLEIEATTLSIPNEKELFLNCFPEFREWAESKGVKNKHWYEKPDSKFTHN